MSSFPGCQLIHCDNWAHFFISSQGSLKFHQTYFALVFLVSVIIDCKIYSQEQPEAPTQELYNQNMSTKTSNKATL